LSPDVLESKLRALDPPVIARIENDRVLFDLRTVAAEDDEELRALLCGAALLVRTGQ
jgi:seryl-tRNA(Sec) selenium transferase